MERTFLLCGVNIKPYLFVLQTQLITFTTDFGLTDGSVTLLKLHIAKHLPNIAFNDISHDIKALQISHAAYLIENLYPHFPAASLHVILVNSHHHKNSELIFAKCNEHYFLSPNNGIFNLLFQNKNTEYRKANTLHKNNQFNANIAEAIRLFFDAHEFNQLGEVYQIEQLNFRDKIKKDASGIKGTIWLIDSFGNLITNIHRNDLIEMIGDKKIEIHYGYKEPLTAIHSHVYDVDTHEPVAYFNQFNYLEIAIRNYNISRIFNLKEGDSVKIIPV